MSRRKTDKPISTNPAWSEAEREVAQAVYAHVFAAVWVKRQDLGAERRRTTASVEASLAMNAARGAYAVELGVKPEEQG